MNLFRAKLVYGLLEEERTIDEFETFVRYLHCVEPPKWASPVTNGQDYGLMCAALAHREMLDFVDEHYPTVTRQGV